MGLYGNILVVPADPDYWPPVNREVSLTLDDILIETARSRPSAVPRPLTPPWAGSATSLLGRWRERLLAKRASAGEVVRFYLTNTANTRVFKVALPGARIKLVGGDSGRVRARGVRRVCDPGAVRARRHRCAFRRAGRADARAPHTGTDIRTRARSTSTRGAGRALARRSVRRSSATTLSGKRSGSGWQRSSTPPPDKTLAFDRRDGHGRPRRATVVYACPMHPQVVSDEPAAARIAA